MRGVIASRWEKESHCSIRELNACKSMARVASSGRLSVIAPTKFAFVGVNCGSDVCVGVKSNHLIFYILSQDG